VAGITSPLSDTKIAHLQGAVSEVDEDEAAFGNRDAPFVLNINTRWSRREESDKHVQWTREFFEAMEPHSTGGVYVNFLGDEGEDRVRAAYGEANWERLLAVKDTYDPTNFFRLNQNIKPRDSQPPSNSNAPRTPSL
jgi:FAD/FMN-containing dehydrogenase